MIKARVTQVPNLKAQYKIDSRFMKQLISEEQKAVRVRTLKGRGVYGPESNLVDRKHKKGYSEAPAIIPISTPALRKYYRSTLKGGRSKRGMKKGDSKARFVRLPKGYKQYRQIHGRNVSQVDHVFKGTMMNALRFRATNRRATITVSASQLEKAYYTNKLRPWFLMTQKRQRVAANKVAKRVAQLYK